MFQVKEPFHIYNTSKYKKICKLTTQNGNVYRSCVFDQTLFFGFPLFKIVAAGIHGNVVMGGGSGV